MPAKLKFKNYKLKYFLKENYHKINKPKQVVIFLKKSFLMHQILELINMMLGHKY